MPTEFASPKQLVELHDRKAQLEALLEIETEPKRRRKIEKALAKIAKAEEKGAIPVIAIVQLLFMLWKLWQELFPKPKEV